MLNLIKKEFKVSKSWIFLLFLSIVFSFTIFMSTAAVEITGIKFIENVAFSYAVLLIVYVSIVDSSYRDIKNKSEVILNSFPIDRKNIVRGKYIIMILYIIMYSLPMWLTNKIFMPIIYGGESHLEILWSLMIITTISLIFYSIYYPLYFKSEDGLMTFNQTFRIIIILLPSVFGRYMKKIPMDRVLYFMERMGNKTTWIFLLVIAFIFYYISLQISKKIYMAKEF